jgi:C-terminal processing protease CtpA/Prc
MGAQRPKGLVLDLRNDRRLLDAAVAISAALPENATVVSTNGTARRKFTFAVA